MLLSMLHVDGLRLKSRFLYVEALLSRIRVLQDKCVQHNVLFVE